MEEKLDLWVNGQTRTVAVRPPATLTAVLAALNLQADRIAVEHNGQIARKARWDDIAVAAGDKLEVVHFVGGG